MYEIILYRDHKEKEPFTEWLETLNVRTQERVQIRILRMQSGNLGDYKNVGQGVFELRMFFEGGIRVYFGREGKRIVVLLCGGDKSSQQRDIERAKLYWKEYKNDQEKT